MRVDAHGVLECRALGELGLREGIAGIGVIPDDATQVRIEVQQQATGDEYAVPLAVGLHDIDQPFLVQYGHWLQGVVTGDMGRSYISGKLVFDTFMDKLPATVELMLASVGLTLLFAIPLGIYAAVRQNRWPDYIIRFLTFVGNSLPNFFVGLLLIYFLALQAGLFPVMSSADNPLSVVLPAVTLAIAMGAKYTRQIRAVVLEELAKPYVAGARARGVPERWILWHDVLKSSFITIITLLALSVGSLLGGTAIGARRNRRWIKSS